MTGVARNGDGSDHLVVCINFDILPSPTLVSSILQLNPLRTHSTQLEFYEKFSPTLQICHLIIIWSETEKTSHPNSKEPRMYSILSGRHTLPEQLVLLNKMLQFDACTCLAVPLTNQAIFVIAIRHKRPSGLTQSVERERR